MYVYIRMSLSLYVKYMVFIKWRVCVSLRTCVCMYVCTYVKAVDMCVRAYMSRGLTMGTIVTGFVFVEDTT